MSNPWKVEFKDGIWHSIHGGISFEGEGYYELTYQENRYGCFSKEALDGKNTGEILEMIASMLNDVAQLDKKENE